MKKYNILISFLVLLGISVYGQQEKTDPISSAPIIIPPSPTASSLGEFVDFPVTMYTGVPNISIPIYELKGRSISVPISLSYNGGGVKVEEVPSWVGLGWALNAGGLITRSVRGIEDENSVGGFFYTSKYMPEASNFDFMNDQHYEWLEDIAYGERELTPDLFMFNFNGYSGKFYFDSNDQIHLVSHQDIKIISPEVTEFNSSNSIWTILTPDGTKYEFGGANATEETSSTPYADGPERIFISAWYLTKITSITNEVINFTYSPKIITYELKYAETDYINSPTAPSIAPQIAKSIQTVNGVDLSSIASDNTTVSFLTNAEDRQDLNTGGHSLDEVQVKTNFDGSISKRFVLEHDYNTNGGGSSYLDKRLMLRGIREYGSELTGSFKEHKFHYHEGGSMDLPPRDSNAQDHWGFYNGKTNNSTMLPEYVGMPAGTFYADREPSQTHMKAGTLYKIVYPSGGYTQFNFEPHQYQVNENYSYSNDSRSVSLTNAGFEEKQSTAFNINYDQDVTLTINIDFHGAPEQTGVFVEIYDSSDALIFSHSTPGLGQNLEVSLTVGDYYLKLTNMDIVGTDISATIYYSIQTYNPHEETHYKGGLRLASMEQNEGNGATPSVWKYYRYNNYKIFTPLNNDSYLSSFHDVVLVSGDCVEGNFMTYHYTVRSSSSKSVLGSINGSAIGYGTVKVSNDQTDSEGYTVYAYTLDSDIGGGAFPYPPVLSREHRRGLLLSQRDYNATGELLKELDNEYTIKALDTLTGISAGFIEDNFCYSGASAGRIWDVLFYMQFYSAMSEWVQKTKTIDIVYETNGDSLFQTTHYFYNSDPFNQHVQLKGKTQTKSNGDIITNYYKYPDDDPYANGIVFQMHDDHMVNHILESTKWLKEGTDSVLIAAKRVEYDRYNVNNLKVLPARIYQVEPDNPISNSDYLSQPDGYYIEKMSYDYNDLGLMVESTLKNQPSTSMIWGYGSQYPVARIENATYQEAINSLSQIELNLINGNTLSDVEMRAKIDALRQDLPNAMITGYTFDKKGNMTSQTDANGNITYYNYDKLGRLIEILDNEKNLIQSNKYHYRDKN